MAILHALLLASLAVFVASVLGGSAATGVRALGLWRTFRAFQRSLEAALADTVRRIGGVERSLGAAGDRAAELDRSRIRLQAGLREATVLLRAATEAWGLVGRVLSLLPSK